MAAIEDVDEETLSTITMEDLRDLDELSAPGKTNKPKSDEELGEMIDGILKDVPEEKKKKREIIPKTIIRR